MRISVIKLLPLLCKDSKEHVPKAADILAQLLQAKEIENITSASLIQVYKEDPISTVKAVFNLIHNVDQTSEEALVVREKSIQFFYKKLVKMEDKLSQEVVDILLEGGKKIIQVSVIFTNHETFCKYLVFVFSLGFNRYRVYYCYSIPHNIKVSKNHYRATRISEFGCRTC